MFSFGIWGLSSIGRASALQAEGQGFNSPSLHKHFLYKRCGVRDNIEPSIKYNLVFRLFY